MISILHSYHVTPTWIVVVLQQEPGGLGVVLLGGDVEGGQPDLAPGVVLKEDGDDLGEIMNKGSSTVIFGNNQRPKRHET